MNLSENELLTSEESEFITINVRVSNTGEKGENPKLDDDNSNNDPMHEIQWPKLLKPLLGFIEEEEVDDAALNEMSAACLAVIRGDNDLDKDDEDQSFEGLSLLHLAVIFKQYDLIKKLCREMPSLLTRVYEGTDKFFGFLPAHFASYLGDYDALSAIAEVVGWEKNVSRYLVGFTSMDLNRYLPDAYDNREFFENWYPGYSVHCIAFVQGHTALFNRLWQFHYPSTSYCSELKNKVEQLAECYSSRYNSHSLSWDKSEHFSKAVEAVKALEQDITNVIEIFFMRTTVSEYLRNRDLRFFCAGMILHQMYPEFSFQEASMIIRNEVEKLSRNYWVNLEVKLMKEVQSYHEAYVKGTLSYGFRDIAQEFMENKPRHFKLFASQYVRNQLAIRIAKSNFSKEELELIFEEFVNKNLRASRKIADGAMKQYIDEVPISQLHKYTDEIRKTKKELILECLNEVLTDDMVLSPEIIKSIIEEISNTQLRRSEIMSVLNDNIKQLTDEADSSEDAPAKPKTYIQKSFGAGSLAKLPLLDSPILKQEKKEEAENMELVLS